MRTLSPRRIGVTLLAAVSVCSLALVDGGSASASSPGGRSRAPNPTQVTIDTTAAYLAHDKGLDIAAATRRVESQDRQAAIAGTVLEQLGGRSGGGYFDDSGTMVITVTDAAAADEVRAAGLVARTVSRSLASLQAIVADLNTRSSLVHSTWGIDVEANQVVVSIPIDAVTRRDPAEAALRSVAGSYGAAVRVTETADKPELLRDVAGGDPMRPTVNVADFCSAGFNVKYGNQPYMLIAGHCLKSNYYGYWNWDGGYLGNKHAAFFPYYDFGLIKITEPVTQIRGVYTYNGLFQPITHHTLTWQGQYVCKSGVTTAVTCGEIVANYITANYPQGTVVGLDVGNLCSAGGDSGGSMFAGTAALGIVSGGNLYSCYTYFQRVGFAMGNYGVTLA